jgi:hypothetical protein
MWNNSPQSNRVLISCTTFIYPIKCFGLLQSTLFTIVITFVSYCAQIQWCSPIETVSVNCWVAWSASFSKRFLIGSSISGVRGFSGRQSPLPIRESPLTSSPNLAGTFRCLVGLSGLTRDSSFKFDDAFKILREAFEQADREPSPSATLLFLSIDLDLFLIFLIWVPYLLNEPSGFFEMDERFFDLVVNKAVTSNA